MHKSFDDFITIEELYQAWCEFKKGKSKRADVQLFEQSLEDNLFTLQNRLKNKTYRHGNYHAFYVHDPKQRHIHKAKVVDRVVHHLLYNYLYELFDHSFIFDSYSCRLDKGTHIAVSRLDRFCKKVSKNYTGECYALKLDIKKFFASVDHSILRDILCSKIYDKEILWLLDQVIASFAQHDNDVRSERTKNGMRARFLSGLVVNRPPLGYINQSGYVLKDEKSFELVKKAWDLMATGTKSLREIAGFLNKENITYKGEFHTVRANTVQRMFRNKFYMGILTSDKYPEQVKGQHIPMVTEEQFYKIQSILDGKNVSTPLMARKSRDNEEFPYRRIIKCCKCGASFCAAWSRGRSIRYGYYFCQKRCVMSSIPIKDIKTDVNTFLEGISPTPSGLKLYINCLLKTYNLKKSQLDKTKLSADEEILKLQALRQVLVEKNLAGIYSDEIFKEQNVVIESKIIGAQQSKNDSLIDQYDMDKIEAFIKEKLSNLAITCSDSTLSQLRCLIGSILMTGMVWGYPGILNREFSPAYQAILDADKLPIPLGDPNDFVLEPASSLTSIMENTSSASS